MTEVYYDRSADRFLLTCKGHAGYAESGKDIVCAGISALCGALEITLNNLQEKGMAQSHYCCASDGYFYAEAQPASMNTGVETAFDTVYDGLCRIETAFAPYLRCRRSTAGKEENDVAV